MDLITALGVPAWIVGLGLAFWLMVTGKLVLSADADKRVAAATATAEAVSGAAVVQLTARVGDLSARLDSVIADRNAWRDAHSEEVEARRAAETTAAKLMETGNLALALLEALKDQLGRERA